MLANVKSTLSVRPTWQLRVLRIAFFVALTALAAKIRIEIPGNPVPITAQTLAVLLAGMALGPIEGGLSQIVYLGLIAIGLPLDSRSIGAAALLGPTAGYLVGFVPGAIVAGLFWNRKSVVLNVLVGLVAVLVIQSVGTAGVAMSQKLSWNAAVLLGSAPFIAVDFGKALLAAALVNLGRQSFARWG